MAASDCIFCRIVAGDAPASFVHRDQHVSVFLDIQPLTPGHLLVVPNEHVVHVRELPEPVGDRLFSVARRLARTLPRSGLRAEGTNVFASDGAAAGQEVFHAHLHVLPRFTGDGIMLDAAAHREAPPSRQELEEWAAQIRSAIDREREVEAE